MILRDYQIDLVNQFLASDENLLAQLDTGGGKTAIIADVVRQRMPFIVVAHRKRLIEQISETVARFDIEHSIIAAKDTKRRCAMAQKRFGKSVINQCSSNVVASLDSLLSWHRRGKLDLDQTLRYTIFVDEGHHAADENKWVMLKTIFPNARICGVTATPGRLDGSSLHIDNGGLYQRIIQAESLKENSVKTLIALGWLAEFRAYGIPNEYDMSMLKKGASSDYSPASIKGWTRGCSTLIEDAIQAWKRIAPNKKTVVFCPTIENADFMADEYRKQGIAAAYIASNLSAADISRRLDLFRLGQITILLSVDMISEGFDLPEIECIQMLRPTVSLMLYRQMCGRVLRPMPGKPYAIIIDHVGNICKFGLPDTAVEWDIHGVPKSHPVLQLPCSMLSAKKHHWCHFVYNAYAKQCPECGEKNGMWDRRDFINEIRITELGVIDIKLVLLTQQMIEQQKRKEQLASTPLPPRWSYTRYTSTSGMINNVCEKLAHWFYAQLLLSTVTPTQINQFTQTDRPPDHQFWMKNFSAKDLGTKNPDKCKQVLEQWQSS